MDKAYIKQLAEDFAHSLCLHPDTLEFSDAVNSFIAGAECMQEQMEAIEISKNR